MTAITTKAQAITVKLNAAQALVVKYTAELEGLNKYDGIVKGDLIGFVYGRADTKTNKQGEVVAVSVDAKGNKVFNVLVTADNKPALFSVTPAQVNGHQPKQAAPDSGVDAAPAAATVETNIPGEGFLAVDAAEDGSADLDLAALTA